MKKVLTRNIPLKLLSFFLAILLWVVIMNMDDPYITATITDIPVMKVNTNVLEEKNKLYEVLSGEKATIKIRGKRSIIEKLGRNNFTAVADFKEMSLVYAVPIHIKPIDSSDYKKSDIEIMEQTQMMTIALEDGDTQSFRVNVKATGEVKDGYFVTDMIPNPNVIEISGSKTQISKIKEVVVEVSIDQASGSNKVIAKPMAIDKSGYIISDEKLNFQTNEIAVTTTVLPTKEIGIYVDIIGEPYYGYVCGKTQYDPLTVVIAGEQKDLDEIGYIIVPLDVSLSKENIVVTKNIEDYLSQKYHLVSESKSVAITQDIEKQESKEVSLYPSFITALDLDENLEAIIKTPGTIKVNVYGTQENLESITAAKLQPYMELAGLGVGNYNVSVHFARLEGIEIKPVTISIEIIKK